MRKFVSDRRRSGANGRLGSVTSGGMRVVAGEALVPFKCVEDDWTERRPTSKRRPDARLADVFRPPRNGNRGRPPGGLRRSSRDCRRGRRTLPANSAGFVRRGVGGGNSVKAGDCLRRSTYVPRDVFDLRSVDRCYWCRQQFAQAVQSTCCCTSLAGI